MEQNRKSEIANRKCLIVGCGYVGLSLGRELARRGHEVFGLRRSVLAEAELKAAGIKPLHADITRPETLADLPRDFDWVVNCAASGGGDAADYRKIYLEGNRQLVAWLAGSPLKKFVFTSSTSVYGQNDGSRVTEKSPAEPEAATAKVLVETEKLLLASAARSVNLKLEEQTPHPGPLPIGSADSADAEREKCSRFFGETKAASCSLTGEPAENVRRLSPLPAGEGQGEGESAAIQPAAGGSRGCLPRQSFPAVILRVAGIYGPGRGHLFKQFLRGEAKIEGNGTRFLNMIHRDDLIGVILAALENGTPGEIYNAVDDEPVTQLNFFRWLAETLKKELPPFAPEEISRKRGVTSKRVSNAKLRTELNYAFHFPDFRAGYAAEIRRLAEVDFPV